MPEVDDQREFLVREFFPILLSDNRPSCQKIFTPTFYESYKSTRQFGDSFYLPRTDRIVGNQLTNNTEGDRARNDVLRSSLLVNACRSPKLRPQRQSNTIPQERRPLD